MKSIHVRLAKSLADRTRGLIGKYKIEPLLLETRFGIHTFGMKKPIDILILDKDYHIQVIKKRMKPNRIFLWNPRYSYVLELPQDFISHNKLKKMEKIELAEKS